MNAFRLSRRPELGRGIRVSFEFFPPKNAEMEEKLWQTINRLAPLEPDFVSVTYGAGGSTKGPTGETVKRLISETGLKTAAHLTCVNASKAQILDVVQEYRSHGVEAFVALRGDPATGMGTAYVAHPDGYQTSADLIAGLKEIAEFDISVSAYPEKHPESRDYATDIDLLKRKVDAGADRAITQFFFDNDLYEAFVEKVRRAGIYIPILPGILPVHNFRQVTNFCSRSGTHVPAWLAERFEGLDNDPQTHALVASAVAAEQVLDLVERGVQDFHFYTMNRPDLVFAICHLIGIRAPQAGAAAQAA
ncbi:MAG: methylenetetrahydrofolate reductase [NAD(P)H] [Rhizobiaceae bacterium]